MPHPDVPTEQAHLDRAYRCLAAMRGRAERLASISESAAQAVDSAIVAAHLEHRARSLADDVPGLAFGRIDEETGPAWYVGRRHVEDDHGDPVVVDWRAAVATPFYRATAADPLGLRRRRRFMITGQRIDDLFEEVFDDPDSIHAAMHGGIPDPLLAELERARTGEMRDIVATIQAEQDEVIRAPLATCMIVQGGPGTGKTAVGLHRAAFLLYEHRRLLHEQGVLVLGPNPVFLRYISQVLPSLGEVAVRQSTIERLLSGVSLRVRATDSTDVARIKGEARMADVVRNAVWGHVRKPSEGLDEATSWGTMRVDAHELAALLDEIVARDIPFAVGRQAFRTRVHRLVAQRLATRRGDVGPDRSEVEADLRGNRAFQGAVARLWPTVSAPTLVRRLLTSPRFLAEAAAGILDRHEIGLVRRRGARRLDDEAWTVADLVLIDEAEAAIGGPPRTYGHVVVDEAQDLSAMEFRAIARRCPSRSMTVLGDLAQATAPAAQDSWDEVVAHLGSPATADFTELDLGYRVPAPILDFANRLLAVAAPGLTPARSVREQGRPPSLVGVTPDTLVGEVVRVATEQAARWASVGVIVPDELYGAIGANLDGTTAAGGLAGTTLLRPPEAKGLEFDAVVVVEPALVAGTTSTGARLLYVALSRAVQELSVLHARPLPAPLAAAS
ncbi:MAG: HelD family protein [Acidimicrobiales bacterium]